jgi:hypothetical protein
MNKLSFLEQRIREVKDTGDWKTWGGVPFISGRDTK